VWKVEFDQRAFKDLERLQPLDQRRVARFIDERLLPGGDPRSLGTTLKGKLSGLWRYRVGDIRIIAQIDDGRMVIMVVGIGKRSRIYR